MCNLCNDTGVKDSGGVVTQAPMTAFIIVMEMVDGYNLVLSLMACSLVASGVSRLVSRPLYASLTELQLGRLPTMPAGRD